MFRPTVAEAPDAPWLRGAMFAAETLEMVSAQDGDTDTDELARQMMLTDPDLSASAARRHINAALRRGMLKVIS